MNCPFSACILCVLDENFGNEWSDLQCRYCDLDINDLLAPVSNSISLFWYRKSFFHFDLTTSTCIYPS